MALPQGINFRATVPYVTDGGTEFCQIPPGTGGNYPTTTPQGNVVGFEGTAFGQIDSRNRSTTVDVRLAGSNFTTTAATATYRIDLPAAGSYNIRLAAGDASFTSNVQIELFDDTTSLGVLASATSLSGGQFKDATNVTLSSAAWPGSNTAVTKTFSSTICRIKIGTTAGNNRFINHFYIESASGGGASGTFSATLDGVAMSAAGLSVNAGSFASTLGALTMSASGVAGASPSGTLASTLGSVSMSASGLVAVPGALSATLAGVVMSASGTVNNAGTFSASLDGVTMAAAGAANPNASGSMAATLGGVTMAAAGYVGTPPPMAEFFTRLPKNPRHYLPLS